MLLLFVDLFHKYNLFVVPKHVVVHKIDLLYILNHHLQLTRVVELTAELVVVVMMVYMHQ
jgi:hypothetical protein